mmetsp:Transcript_58566/g.93112  ORF Transcript_58566/g.93112 Transcript_58566/m.93112 type:complete len:212 (+) Transcript_58566:753-1388(+)
MDGYHISHLFRCHLVYHRVGPALDLHLERHQQTQERGDAVPWRDAIPWPGDRRLHHRLHAWLLPGVVSIDRRVSGECQLHCAQIVRADHPFVAEQQTLSKSQLHLLFNVCVYRRHRAHQLHAGEVPAKRTEGVWRHLRDSHLSGAGDHAGYHHGSHLLQGDAQYDATPLCLVRALCVCHLRRCHHVGVVQQYQQVVAAHKLPEIPADFERV